MSREKLLKSKGFCMLPWTHLHIRPDGGVYTCCLADYRTPIGNLKKSELPEIWNSPEMKRVRTEMLTGALPKQCDYCDKLERDTGGSFRVSANSQYEHQMSSMLDVTRDDGHVDKFNAVYIDFRFSNLCNFKCRSCGTYYSNSWAADEEKLAPWRHKIKAAFRDKPKDSVQIGYRDEQQFEEILELILPELEQIYFAGGEPLISEEHYRILDEVLKRGKFATKIRYNTNFSLLKFKGRDVTKMWDQLEEVYVQASLDGSYARGEYLRKGQNWARTVANRKKMMRDCPRVRFGVSATVSAYNVWHLPDFCREWIELGYVAEKNFNFNPLYGPEAMRMQILPVGLKNEAIKKYEALLDGFITNEETRRRIEGVISVLKSEDESANFGAFIKHARNLDKIRNESVLDVFPEIAPYVKPRWHDFLSTPRFAPGGEASRQL